MLVGIGLLLVAAAVVTFVPLDNVDVGGASLDLELQAGKIEASNNLATSSSVMNGPQGMLALRRVMIVNMSDHAVMRKVTERVAERLLAMPMVDTVDAFHAADGSEWPNQGGRLYDFYLTLDMPKFDTRGAVIAGRQAEVTVTVDGGQSPWDSHHGYNDDLTPPTARISFQATLQHRSTTTGYESAGARYKLMIENIADQLAASLTNNFGEWSAKHASVSDVPDEFLPPYRPVPDDLPLPDSPDLARVISGSSLMTHNFSVWAMPTDDPVAVLRDLRDRLDKAGWRVPKDENFGEDIWSRHFRATDKGSRVYEAFQVRPNDPAGQATPVRIVIEYRDRMTRQDMQPTIDRLLAEDDPPLAMLLRFESALTREQGERLTKMMLDAPPATLPPHAHLRVARHLHRKGMDERVLDYLNTAYLLAQVADAKTEQIEKLAKEITGKKNWKPDPPDASDLDRLGIRVINPGESVTVEVDLDEPVVCYQMTRTQEAGHEGPMLVTAVVLRSAVPEGRYTLRTTYRSILSGGKSSSANTPHDRSIPWRSSCGIGTHNLSWHSEAEEIGENRFRVTLHASQNKPPSTSP